jgi:hypothetical protein
MKTYLTEVIPLAQGLVISPGYRLPQVFELLLQLVQQLLCCAGGNEGVR